MSLQRMYCCIATNAMTISIRLSWGLYLLHIYT